MTFAVWWTNPTEGGETAADLRASAVRAADRLGRLVYHLAEDMYLEPEQVKALQTARFSASPMRLYSDTLNTEVPSVRTALICAIMSARSAWQVHSPPTEQQFAMSAVSFGGVYAGATDPSVSARRFLRDAGRSDVEASPFPAADTPALRLPDAYAPLKSFPMVGFGDGAVWICERPVEVVGDDAGGHELTWADGFQAHFIGAARHQCDAWIVRSEPEKLDPQAVLKIPNADVRALAMRKMGIERLLTVLDHKVVHKKKVKVGKEKHPYELLEFELPGRRTEWVPPTAGRRHGDELGGTSRSKALKMRNPSIGIYHIEFVHPECRTVDEALAFRYTGSTNPNDWRDYRPPTSLS